MVSLRTPPPERRDRRESNRFPMPAATYLLPRPAYGAFADRSNSSPSRALTALAMARACVAHALRFASPRKIHPSTHRRCEVCAVTSPKSPTRTLTSILVETGIINESQVEVALARQRETGHLIGETLVGLGFTSEENIGWALSKQLGIPYVDVRPEAIDAEQVRRFPEAVLRRVQAVP